MFTIGTDPEFSLVDCNGELVSAIPYIKGTKEKPHILSNGAGLHWDNVALEFASPVADSISSFVGMIRKSLLLVKKEVPEFLKMIVVPSAIYPEEQLQDPGAKSFGCSPDFNAWSPNEKVVHVPPNPGFRSFGGHVSVGDDDRGIYDFLTTPVGIIDTVKTMDCILGVIFVALEDNLQSKERRLLYGRAGSCRPKPFGLEYRVLSNYWLSSPLLCKLVYSLVDDCLRIVLLGDHKQLFEELEAETSVVDTINNSNVRVAEDLYEYTIAYYISKRSRKLITQAFCSPEFNNLENEWGLTDAN